jgi:hypothetical protein
MSQMLRAIRACESSRVYPLSFGYADFCKGLDCFQFPDIDLSSHNTLHASSNLKSLCIYGGSCRSDSAKKQATFFRGASSRSLSRAASLIARYVLMQSISRRSIGRDNIGNFHILDAIQAYVGNGGWI